MVAIAAVLRPQALPSGLLSVARPLPQGWERGVEVVIGSLSAPDRIGPCAVGDGSPQPKGSVARFEPVVIRQGILCSLLGRPDTEAEAREALRATAGYALSQELHDGLATTNPTLSDVTDNLGTTDNVKEGLGALEEAAYTTLSGRLAVIHVPVGLSALVDSAAFWDNGVWRTYAGNLVAVHGTGNTMYATGEVWASIGSTFDTRRYDNPRDNASEGWADVAALAVFDPAFVAAVTVTGGTSPTS